MVSTAESFLIGGAAACTAVTVSNPFEVAKVRLQLQGELSKGGEKVYKNVGDVLVKTWRHEGVVGIQRGLFPAYVYQVLLNGSRLGFYEPLRRTINRTFGYAPGEQLATTSIAAGASSGVIGAMAGNPFFLIKARMQAYNPVLPVGTQHYYKHSWDALSSVWKAERWRGLIRGMDAAIIRTAMGSSVQLPSYNWTKRTIVENGWGKADSTWTFLASSAVSGACVCMVMQPADTALTRMYNQPTRALPNGKLVGVLYSNPIDCLWKTLKTEGPLGWYKAMRGLAVSAALLSGLAAAADVEKPTFTPTAIQAPFLEQFTGDWQERWTPSEATKKTAVGGETFSYVGKWSVEEPFKEVSIVGDKGLVAKDKATHHAISAPIVKPVNPKGKTLVIQYEAKFQKVGNCGGGYVKLLEEGALANKEFSDTTPWVIMFGPDLTCPGTKVHFIFRHQNPITKEWEEKHLKTAPSPVIDDFTKLYTLIVNPDNSYQVLIDDEVASEGSLLEDFSPSVNPDKEIDDPEDKKPEDWVDEAQIRDPAAVKPEDWDEDEPFQIVDEDAEIPEGWLVDEPKEIPDPDAVKPEEWDDEEDGDWIPPMVRNPKCDEAPGCGTWTKPMKTNPKFKGKWEAPLIDNPAYKGVWAPRKIPNPNYYEDLHPADLRPIGAVGYEIWTMTEDIMFDNVYVGHSVDDAKKLAEETWYVKHKVEKAIRDADAAEKKAQVEAEAKAKKTASTDDVLARLKEDPAGFVREKVMDFVEDVQEEGPIAALQSNPQVGGAILASLLTFFGAIAAIFGVVGSSAPPVVKSVKKTSSSPAAADGAKKTPSDVPSVVASEPAAAASSTATSKDTPVKKRK
ncbi:hypothetical protein FRC04_011962 [Tulasnella sp. 424]|nr:hypothetical protein FRC04_011962 [Tulasnella sp. 424]KAG8971338.1 hypothetical protein FRC05_011330 [Tulasnella sp. 425]